MSVRPGFTDDDGFAIISGGNAVFCSIGCRDGPYDGTDRAPPALDRFAGLRSGRTA